MATFKPMQSQATIAPQLENWARGAIARVGKRLPRLESGRRRKLLLVHLDGVPRPVLEEGISSGRMPFLASLVGSGAYQLDSAFWGFPASTPGFQAGALLGLRHPNLPAYHWFDRKLGRVVHMNFPADAKAIEDRLVPRPGSALLDGGGTSYLSLFRLGSTNPFSMTALADVRRLARSVWAQLPGLTAVQRQGLLEYFLGVVRDTFKVSRDIIRWAARLGDWRHEGNYLLNRFFLTALAWELAHSRALIDLVRGVPVIYVVFANYDEVAHRRGPFSPQAQGELYRADGYLAELFAIARLVEPAYDVVFLTDHGAVESVPLETTLGARLEPALFDGPKVPLSPGVERALLDGRAPDGQGHDLAMAPVVVEAGNFAHVYLSPGGPPMEAREVLSRHREPLSRAVSSPGIGVVALRRGDQAVAVVGGEVFTPAEVDRAPLPQAFSKRALKDLLDELPYMRDGGDLVLIGAPHGPGGTVGFAWEFGSHGGITRLETESVICWPSDGPVNLGGLGHPTQLYELLSEAYRG
ncbi:MAG: alkaline phosphatase family protein [Myxococcaceae bacterium]